MGRIVDIRKLIANAYSEFGDATNERKVSIAIQCGVFCQQVFVESFGCPSELLSLWKIALQDGDVKVRQAAVTGLHLCTPPNASEFSDEIRITFDDQHSWLSSGVDQTRVRIVVQQRVLL